KKPIARTSSFTQYEEWRDRIDNDVQSDTSSAEDRSPSIRKQDARRHSDMPATGQSVLRDARPPRRRMLSRELAVNEHTSESEAEVSQPVESEVHETVFAKTSSTEDPENKPVNSDYAVTDKPIIELKVDKNRSDWSLTSTQQQSGEHYDLHGLQQNEMNTSEPQSRQEVQDDKPLHQTNVDQTANIAETCVSKEQSGLEDPESSYLGYESDAVIHPETAEVKSLFLREQPTLIDRDRDRLVTSSSNSSTFVLNVWSDSADRYPERMLYDHPDIAIHELTDMYESFNSTFDEDPLYADHNEFELASFRTAEIGQSEGSTRDKWFGSQEIDMTSQPIQPDSFFAAETIRRSCGRMDSSNETDVAQKTSVREKTESNIMEMFEENEGNQVQSSFIREESLDQSKQVDSRLWLSVDPQPYPGRRASTNAQLQGVFVKSIDANVDSQEFRRFSAPHTVVPPQLFEKPPDSPIVSQCEVNKKESTETHSLIEPDLSSCQYSLKHLAQKRFSYPFDVTQQNTRHGDRFIPVDLETTIAEQQPSAYFKGEYARLDVETPQLPVSQPSAACFYPDVDAYERWLSDITGPTVRLITSKPGDLERGPERGLWDSTEHDLSQRKHEDENLSILRRCPNFENISGLSEQVQTHSDNDAMQIQKFDERFQPELEAVEEEQEIYNQPDDEPTRIWYRDPPIQATVDPSMLTTLQQEDEIWATLFSPSDSLVESAKEVAAQLDLMTLAEEEASEALENQSWDHLTSYKLREFKQTYKTAKREDQLSAKSVRNTQTDVRNIEQKKDQYDLCFKLGASTESDILTFPSGSKFTRSDLMRFEVKSHRAPPTTASTTSPPPPPLFTPPAPQSRQGKQVTVEEATVFEPHLLADSIWSSSSGQEDRTTMDEVANPRSSTATKLLQPSESIEQHAMNEVNEVQTGRHMERTANQTKLLDRQINREVNTDVRPVEKMADRDEEEREVTCLGAVVSSTQPLPAVEHKYEDRIQTEEFRLNANFLTPTSSASVVRTWPQIDAQRQSSKNALFTNHNRGDSPVSTGLAVGKFRSGPGEAKREQIGEHQKEPDDAWSPIGQRHAPLSDSRAHHHYQSPNKSTLPLVLQSVTVDETGDESLLQSVTDEARDTVCCEQPTSDILSPPIPVCSAISPQRETSLIRLSVQRDRGLGLARRTLTSPRSGSPDTSDSFLSLLDISPETEVQPNLTEFAPGNNLGVRLNYVPPVACCAAWSFCSHTHLLAQGSRNTSSDQVVITTEPVLLPTVPNLDYCADIADISPVSVTNEPNVCGLNSGRIVCSFRRRVLEEIQEDQVLCSTQPSESVPGVTPENVLVTSTFMSSSSSSRASHFMPRRRPRSTSYTYDYYRSGVEEPFGQMSDLTRDSHALYYSDRTKQRSLTDVTPKNGYDLYWNESDISPSYANGMPSRVYPYDNGNSSTYAAHRSLTGRMLDDIGNRYAGSRVGEDPKRIAYPQSYSASQTIDRHRSLPTDEYDYYKDFSRLSRNVGLSRVNKYGTGPRSNQRITMRRGYPRPSRIVGDDRRWQFRNSSYGSGARDSAENSGSNLSDEAEFAEGRSQLSLPLSYTAARRLLDSSTPATRTSWGVSRADHFHSLRRPASLSSSRFTSQQLGGNKSLSRSTDHLNVRRGSGFSGADTSMQTLRARLAAAHSESHLDRSADYLDDDGLFDRARHKFGSLDRRLHSDHMVTQQLRRQVEKQHRQLLRSLMDDKPSSSLWPPDFSLLLPSTSTPFSVNSLPITPHLLTENSISPVIGVTDRGPGTLISTTGAPPIFSTATSRSGLGPVYGWPINVPLSMPETVPSAFAQDFVSPAIQVNPMLLDPSGTQWQTTTKPLTADTGISDASLIPASRPPQPPPPPSVQTPSTTSLLELLGNTELLQSVASDPAISSQLASLGIDLTVPQANQVTLAAVAGAVAATAIAQSGVFENSDLNDPQSIWADLNTMGTAEQTTVGYNGSIPMNNGPALPTEYTDTLPPYTISNCDNQNLENLLQQLQSALATDIASDHFYHTVSSLTQYKEALDNGIGMRIVGGHIRSDGKLGAFVEEIYPRGPADQLHGEIREGDEILEWNSIPLVGKTFEEVQSIISQVSEETELLVRARHDGSTERESSQPWEISRTPVDSRSSHAPKRVDALCHHHAAQQALIGIQSRSMCPHMQRHYLSMSPSEIRQSPIGLQSSTRTRSSPTGSDSNSSNARKSSTGQALWMGGPDPGTRESPVSHTRTHPYSPPHASRASESRDLEDFDVDDSRPFDHQSQSTNSYKRERSGSFKLILTFDDYDQSLTVHVSRARDLPSMDLNGLADPFVKVRLHPDPTEDPDFNRQTKYMPNTLTPEWQQTVVFMNCFKRTLKRRVLEVTVWDFDRLKTNDFMGQTLINLGVLPAGPQ
ncbi:unnamed protein product, partial [Echinostoma caproni]|uniref:PDZ domain-containing protein n=1 Tax=Echinostoma caproni TaxID=27848 RepID=A0A183A9Y7_9TREM